MAERYPVLFLALLLAGCGGGGGGPVAATAPAPSAPAPVGQPSGTVPLNLQAASTTVPYPVAALFDGATPVSTQNGTITLTTDAGGNVNKMVFSLPAQSFTAIPDIELSSPRTASAGQLASILYQTLGFPNTVGYILSQVAGSQTLSSSAYGVWANGLLKIGGDAGPFAFGNLTPPASVPATGSATFSGSVIGMGMSGGSTAFALDGNAQIVANFSNQSVAASLTNLRTLSAETTTTLSPPLPDLAGTAAISGNAYFGPVAGGAFAGTIGGNFYGAGAAETVGVFTATGGGNFVFGSFGAKK